MSQTHDLAPWLMPVLVRLQQSHGHAWLLGGSKGLGQFDVALALAASWLCETTQQGLACGNCDACHMVQAKSHPDFMVLLPETLSLALGWPLDEKTQADLDEKKRKPSKQIKLEAVLDVISFAQRTSSRGQGLVVVIYPAEAMNHVSANALLKSLEEPAGHTRFVLASENSMALLPTIRSRCQSLTLTLPDTASARTWLTEQGVSAADADVWLKAAGGQPQTAWQLAQALGKTSAWLGLPQLVARGAPIAEFPAWVVETPAILTQVLHKLCHDWLCAGQGALPRFFESRELLAAAPHINQAATRQAALYKLTAWSQALHRDVRVSEHTLNAGLMMEALLAQAKQAVALR